MAISFDPINKRIILDSAYAKAADVYSRWKEWVALSDNAKYLPAFSVLGGDPLGGGLFVASYFFLLNGWRIRPMEANQTLILDGNITVYGGGTPIVPTLGNFNVSAQYTVPVQAQGIATSGGNSDPNAIAAAVAALLSAQMAKLDKLTFTGNDVNSNITEIAGKPLKTWDGSNWV
jgi:hypothetical protein